jgi:hypothetical protein
MSKRIRQLAMFMAMAVGIMVAAGGLVSAGLQDRNDDDDRDEHGHRKFSFALWGDTPYLDVEKTTKIPALIQDINDSRVAFTVFDGDIKSGSSRCDDVVYQEAIARFNTFDEPMIYVPGDNEWTDCHRRNNGSFDPLDRLAYIRSTMFASPESFGREKLLLEHQDSYPENTRWLHEGVVFVTLNIPGSNNNKVNPGQCIKSNTDRKQPACDAANAEYAARDAANIQFLKESFGIATDLRAHGLVVVMQADPSFDLPETETDNERTCVRAAQGECLDPTINSLPPMPPVPPTPPDPNLANYDGYDAFLKVLRDKTVEFGTIGGQVVLVHGDTHFFKVDKPLDGPTSLLPNFTRLCTFGSPGVNWVKVTVSPKSRNLFTFEPMIVPQ